MLTYKQFAILLIATFIPFSLYLTTPYIAGADGYAFLDHVCHGNLIPGQPPLTYPLLDLIPCNILIIKLILFCLCFICVLSLAFMGKLFYKNGWLAGLLIWFSPLLMNEFLKFENDQFAYPLLFLAIYFFLKARTIKGNTIEAIGKRTPYDLIALGLITLAAGVWAGGLYLLIAFGLSSFMLLIPALCTIYFYGQKLLNNALPIWGVIESMPIIGLATLGLLLLGILGIKKEFKRQTIFYLVLAALTTKLTFLATPFLALGLLTTWNKLPGTEKGKNAKSFLKTTLTILIIVWAIIPLNYGPKEHNFQAIDYALSLTDNNQVQNDWSYGYWIKWKGGKTNQFSGINPKLLEQKGIIITQNQEFLCPYKEFKEVKVYDCSEH